MNFLIIVDKFNTIAIRKIISDLSTEANNVYVKIPIQPGDGKITLERKQKVDALINFAERKEIDFCIMICHNGNPVMRFFQDNFNPKYGYYDIEHDLFTLRPELTVAKKAWGTFAFTQLHLNYLTEINRHALKARWYKFDQFTFKQIDWNSALIVNSARIDQSKSFEYLHLFNKTYLKPHSSSKLNSLEKNTITNTEWKNTQTLFDIGAICGFWFIHSSSAFVEALMLDCIPIIWRNKNYTYKKESTTILSTVQIQKLNNTRIHALIADEDLPDKIQKLKQSENLRKETLQILKHEWLLDQNLDSVSTVLLNDIQQRIE